MSGISRVRPTYRGYSASPRDGSGRVERIFDGTHRTVYLMSTDLKLNCEYCRGAVTPRRGPRVGGQWGARGGAWTGGGARNVVTFAAIAVRRSLDNGMPSAGSLQTACASYVCMFVCARVSCLQGWLHLTWYELLFGPEFIIYFRNIIQLKSTIIRMLFIINNQTDPYHHIRAP